MASIALSVVRCIDYLAYGSILCVRCFPSLRRKQKSEFFPPPEKPQMSAGGWCLLVSHLRGCPQAFFFSTKTQKHIFPARKKVERTGNLHDLHNLSPTFFTLRTTSLLTSLQFLSVKRDFVFWAWFCLLSMISSFERDFVFWAWFRLFDTNSYVKKRDFVFWAWFCLLSVISSFERDFVFWAWIRNLRK